MNTKSQDTTKNNPKLKDGLVIGKICDSSSEIFISKYEDIEEEKDISNESSPLSKSSESSRSGNKADCSSGYDYNELETPHKERGCTRAGSGSDIQKDSDSSGGYDYNELETPHKEKRSSESDTKRDSDVVNKKVSPMAAQIKHGPHCARTQQSPELNHQGWVSLRLGDIAPNFTADSTMGSINFHEWKKDSWCVFFSHPADFTPVCTTELCATADEYDEFTKRNVKPIALSVDSVLCHQRWLPDLLQVGGRKIEFPILADDNLFISYLYSMIHPGDGATSTVRSVFIIDTRNVVRTILIYPKSVGRNFKEIIRIIDALQCTDSSPVATPANWKPGDRVIISPHISTDDANKFLQNVTEIKPYLRYADHSANVSKCT